MAIRKTFIKVEDTEKGPTREEYETICRALGIVPKPPKNASTDAK